MSESDSGGVGSGGGQQHTYRDDVMDMETFVTKLIHRLCQYIVQSRQGELTKAKSDPNATRQVWFSVSVKELSEISQESSRALNNANRNTQQGATAEHLQRLPDNMVPNPLLAYFPFSIEISLKTVEGDTMVLENWVLSLKDASDPIVRRPPSFNSNDVYYRLGVMIKSALIVSRALPAYKLSRRQGPETFVVMYRPFLGDCSTAVLGEGFQTHHVSQIPTPAGTICLRVDFRTSMTIAPSTPYYASAASSGASSNSNTAVAAAAAAAAAAASAAGTSSGSGNAASGSSVSNLSSQPIMMVKSDHFHFHEKPRGLRSGDESSDHTVTSDESQEAFRMFMASPADPSRAGGGALMEENLGRKLSGDDSDSCYEKFKVGAFATKVPPSGTDSPSGLSGRRLHSGGGSGGHLSDSSDPLMQLFARTDKTDRDRDEAEEKKADEAREDSGAATVRQSEDEQSSKEDLEKVLEELKVKEEKSEFEFVDFKTPFSIQAKMESGPQDLNNFFEETRKAKELPVLIGAQETTGGAASAAAAAAAAAVEQTASAELESLDLQLKTFETNLAEYDEMLKTLETASESESDYCAS